MIRILHSASLHLRDVMSKYFCFQEMYVANETKVKESGMTNIYTL